MNTPARSCDQISSMLMDPGVIAVIRAQSVIQVHPICEALIAGGIVAIEITMTTPGAIAIIRQAHQEFSNRAVIGVGTVLDVSTCEAALAAGAEFVVSPVCRRELIGHAHGAGRPVMIGAYTPTEAQLASEAGADFIKIFPAETLGPGYIKSLLAPLPHLRCVPTGGVDLRNIGEFFKAGCAAVGVGSSLMPGEIIKEQNWPEIVANAKAFVSAAKRARS